MSKTFRTLTVAQVAAVATSLALAAVRPASAQDAIHVPVTGVETEAQVSQQLQAQGYSGVALTPQQPNLYDPHPELYSAANEQSAPVHVGWNGTASKDGHTVDVYVDPQPTQSARGRD